jgi:hypothetical protein
MRYESCLVSQMDTTIRLVFSETVTINTGGAVSASWSSMGVQVLSCHLGCPVTHSAYLNCFCNLTSAALSGFLHVALGCWVLLMFGPRSSTQSISSKDFCPLICILGGICGNVTSFVHTTEITVCGT